MATRPPLTFRAWRSISHRPNNAACYIERVRRLIINADDLGLTQGVNRAIFDANSRGVVTSATLMANSSAFEDAIMQLKCSPDLRLSVGCHLVLVDGTPLTAAPSLKGSNNEFRRSISEVAQASLSGKLDPSDVYAEALEQFRKIQSAGVQLSHFDAHKHSHMFSAILEPALRAAAECNIRAVRNPFEPPNSTSRTLLFKYPKLFKRYLQVAVLRTLRKKWTKLVRKFALKTPDGSLGVIVTGDLDRTLLDALFRNMPEGTWELVCHPGYNDPDLAGVRTRLRESRVHELDLLTSPETKSLIESLGIQLITYNEL